MISLKQETYTHFAFKEKRKKHYGSQNRRGMILNRVSIEKRLAVVDQRSRIGDWEIDTFRGRANYHQLTGFDQRKSAHRHFIIEKNLPSMNPLLKIWMPSFSSHILMPHGKRTQ